MPTTVDKAPGGLDTARQATFISASAVRRRHVDKAATWIVVAGGTLIVGSIMAIMFAIVAKVYPLFLPAKSELVQHETPVLPAAQAPALGVFVEEYREIACFVTATGFQFYSLKDKELLTFIQPKELGSARIVSCSPTGMGRFAVGLSDGRAAYVHAFCESEMKAPTVASNAEAKAAGTPSINRVLHPKLEIVEVLDVFDDGKPVSALDFALKGTEEQGFSPMAAVKAGPREIVISGIEVKKNEMTGKMKKSPVSARVTLPIKGEISTLCLDHGGESLYAGTSDGKLVRVILYDFDNQVVCPEFQASEAPITMVGVLNGDMTVVSGDERGHVTSFHVVTPGSSTEVLRKVYDFEPHKAAVTGFGFCSRNKAFITSDKSGVIMARYGTTGSTNRRIEGVGDGTLLCYAPKGDGILSFDAEGAISHRTYDDPHPEITFHSLFAKVEYEGYNEPAYVWQSSGSDQSEPKFCLTPMIFGTLKGALYAMLFAAPLALLAALYTSQFMHPKMRQYVKPTVEIMAGLPSVVLGFIAALWLAPVMQQHVPGLFLLPLVSLAAIVTASIAWRALPLSFRAKFIPGTEMLLLIPVCLGSGWLAFQLGHVLEAGALGGDFRIWLNNHAIGFEQRNSLVVGFAMGFAVIPIIFTIAEDSLSNVPQHLTAASLALGATRWQTALRVVMPTASPGLFSAVMIGMGRAVGETMIVLMATGNTPIMDWSPFNGFLSLAPNVAVELPEAPENGTLFRVLFLAALMLFIFTFILNTVAEVIRLRLRTRYRYL